jgi:hypothetical protein
MVKDHVPALHTAVDRLQRTLRLARNEADQTRGVGAPKDLQP